MTRTARNTSLETRTARTRLRIRRTPYFAKIAKGLRLGYYRGAVAGSWIARHYRGNGVYATEAIGAADDTLEADDINVFDYWQAQEHARRWADRQRQIAEGRLRDGPYTVADAVKDYLGEIAAEKSPAAVQGAKYVFDAWILPERRIVEETARSGASLSEVAHSMHDASSTTCTKRPVHRSPPRPCDGSPNSMRLRDRLKAAPQTPVGMFVTPAPGRSSR